MGDHYSYNYHNPDKKNNIYINPNFNRSDKNVPSLSNNMYLNPNFSHVASNFYNHSKPEFVHQASKTRIHVNPDFIKKANMYSSIIAKDSNQSMNLPLSSSNNFSSYEQKEEKKHPNQIPSIHITKSRYCLVNQKEKVIAKTLTLPVTTTVKVNKYKSVSLNVVKNNLTIKPTKHLKNVSYPQNSNYKTSSKPRVNPMNTRFKYVKNNITTNLNQSQIKHAVVKRYSSLDNKINRSTSRKILHNKLVSKKSNVPCPLFKKYGKCLRKIRSNCDYLHDKKHVSICRKFLTGICHDENCLLSHELSDKKMPTCYFYLQGACTKEGCPYIHVKLNEKTEICKDFLKGYCEKGDQCLFRHINVCRNLAIKEKKTDNSSTSIKNRKSLLVGQGRKNTKKVMEHCAEEHRYFKESVDKNCSDKNVIQPSRIKLGTLPSFIQL